MEKLKDTIVRRKTDVFEYRLIKRNEFVAMYAQYYTATEDGNPRLMSYEVFIINKQKARTSKLGGVVIDFAAKELFPNDEAFGFTAWSITNVERAEARFEELTERVHRAKLEAAN